MEPIVFTDDEEPETPRTYIQQFLSNVETDPRLSLSSKRIRKSHSFAKTPDKNARTREKKYLLRASTSLPSPGSLITPKTNLQHLLLGSDSAKTPLDRRVASARSSRSSTKSILHQAPLEWGQKVSLSPMFSASPAQYSHNIDGDSPSKAFKRPKQHRSFRIPDPPTNVVPKSTLGNQVADAENANGQVFQEADRSLDEGIENEPTSPIIAQQNFKLPSQSKSPMRTLEQINKSLLREKAKEIYELRESSTDENDSFNDPLSSSGLNWRIKSLRKSSPQKNNTPGKRDLSSSRKNMDNSQMKGHKQRLHSPVSNSKNNQSSPDSLGYKDNEEDVSLFLSLSASKSKKSINSTFVHESNSITPMSASKSQTLRSAKNSMRKSSESQSPVKGQSSRNTSGLSAVMNSFRSNRGSPISKAMEVIDKTVQEMNKEVEAVGESLSYLSDTSDTGKEKKATREKMTPGKKMSQRNETFSLSNSNKNQSKIKVSEPNTPIKTQFLRRSPRSPSKIQNKSLSSPLQSQSPRKCVSESGMNDSKSRQILNMKNPNTSKLDSFESKKTPSVKRAAAGDPNPDLDDQISNINMELQRDLPQSHSKRRKTNSLNDIWDETNPSSSTPFKRSRSIFSSTKMHASLASDLASKDTDSLHIKSIAIGDLSPIKPYSEDGPEDVSSDNEDPVTSHRENALEKSRLQVASTSKNKEYQDTCDDQLADDDGDEEEEGEEEDIYSPMNTPVIDMNKLPQPLSGIKSKSSHDKNMGALPKTKDKQLVAKKSKAASAGTKKKSAKSSSFLPRSTVKFMSELYSSMKIDREALDELEKITQQFMERTLDVVDCYSQHAGRKRISEADFVLMLKRQRLIKTKEDLYDLIRKYLPMEMRCELIPCFPSQR